MAQCAYMYREICMCVVSQRRTPACMRRARSYSRISACEDSHFHSLLSFSGCKKTSSEIPTCAKDAEEGEVHGLTAPALVHEDVEQQNEEGQQKAYQTDAFPSPAWPCGNLNNIINYHYLSGRHQHRCRHCQGSRPRLCQHQQQWL